MNIFQEMRARSKNLMDVKGVPMHPYLPLLDSEYIRTPEEVANKIVSLYATAGIAKGASRKKLLEWLNEEGGVGCLDEADKNIFNLDVIGQGLMNELSWRTESLYVMSWVANVIGQINWPDRGCDLEAVFPRIPSEIPIFQFRKDIVIRSWKEILMELDLYYCLHASLRHPELWNSTNRNIRIEIVEERRQALEWVCSRGISWGEISLDT